MPVHLGGDRYQLQPNGWKEGMKFWSEWREGSEFWSDHERRLVCISRVLHRDENAVVVKAQYGVVPTQAGCSGSQSLQLGQDRCEDMK